MDFAFRELSDDLVDITLKCDGFSMQVRQNRVPDYLIPRNLFLGQYMIKYILIYRRILTEKLMSSVSVFNLLTPKGTAANANNLGGNRESDSLFNPKDHTGRTLV